jgi:putative sterol carrier protein
MVEALFQTAGNELGLALPDGAVVSFVLSGPGGGTWTMTRDGDAVRVVRDEPAALDCRLACSVDDFHALVTGHLDGRQGFMDGRLAIEGDVGLILGLQQALSR